MINMFGRFSDSFKSKEKTDFWRVAVESFENKNYFDSFRNFVKYADDDETNNIKLTDNGSSLDIEFYQGTKLIKVKIDDEKVNAESDIAIVTKSGVAFMRRLLELNYGLYYSRFSLKDGMIVLKFDSSIIDCSPSKFYYAIKEIALKADKQDDLLTKDFNMLQPVIEVDTIVIPENEKKIEYKFYKKWIEETIKTVNPLNEKSYEGGISYLLLSLVYKIDFFLLPEGNIVNELEKLSSNYFTDDGKTFIEKNNSLKDGLQKLNDEPENKVIESFYKTISAFSVLNPTNFSPILNVIKDNQKNIKYYIDNKNEKIALAIYEYIFGYCLYNYGMVKCVSHFFKLAMVLINYEYYLEITGSSGNKYFIDENKLDEKLIKDEINDEIKNSGTEYPELSFNTANLNFSSLLNFLHSFLKEIQNLNFNI
ncbi:MAG TPA: hypothetical protein VIL99_17370 [Ignavibacteria bacterium]